LDNVSLARLFAEELELGRPPVGLTFVESRPDGVPDAGAAPSACTFWRRAEGGVFFAPGVAHYECPVGAMTMGFSLPEEQAPRAEALVRTMVQLEYLAAEEVAQMPAVGKPHSGIVYGPLAALPLEPDVVVLTLTPAQAMLVAEAAGSLAQREVPALTAMGRPACSAVARAANTGLTHLSLGCIGARTYLELADNQALVLLPREALQVTADRLGTIARANRELAAFHSGQKARFA
jgi:uncharacterized protein (DUF169 family)